MEQDHDKALHSGENKAVRAPQAAAVAKLQQDLALPTLAGVLKDDQFSYFYLRLQDGRLISIGDAESVLSPRKVRVAIAERIGRVLPVARPREWTAIAQAIFDAAEPADVRYQLFG
jgi:hypothetical protein